MSPKAQRAALKSRRFIQWSAGWRVFPQRSMLAAVLLAACAAHTSPGWADVVVNDVSQLNPIHVRQVLAPTTIEEVVAAVKSTSGPISIGGGRFSMGGQTATDGALQLDMRRMDRVVGFSREGKEITVEPGITWR